ncbi:GerW family sporulation protein [Lysobacter korlensis]|uniref:GerW family sporulation protein n=1 Tax=Lysobacter korlensis TaxID=553636 RepID=A0ABV6RS41_9GAMM
MDRRSRAAEKKLPVFLKESVEKMRSSGSAETVFGPARKENGRTIIPVARVAYGFGGGYGSAAQKGKAGARQRRTKPGANGDTGLGGGGGMRVIPAGMFEVGPNGARFLPVRGSMATTALTLAGGVLVGMLLRRRARPAVKRVR